MTQRTKPNPETVRKLNKAVRLEREERAREEREELRRRFFDSARDAGFTHDQTDFLWDLCDILRPG